MQVSSNKMYKGVYLLESAEKTGHMILAPGANCNNTKISINLKSKLIFIEVDADFEGLNDVVNLDRTFQLHLPKGVEKKPTLSIHNGVISLFFHYEPKDILTVNA